MYDIRRYGSFVSSFTFARRHRRPHEPVDLFVQIPGASISQCRLLGESVPHANRYLGGRSPPTYRLPNVKSCALHANALGNHAALQHMCTCMSLAAMIDSIGSCAK